ncbi:MAG: acetylxylan esterase [Planctomycetota bacterium]|nr:acetylxylan esterase [Planctomycetota bacterium]
MSTEIFADEPPDQYDEAKVPNYKLPDPLVTLSGQPVKDVETWNKVRRPEILELFQTHMYGRSPGKPANMKFDRVGSDGAALGGTAIREDIKIFLNGSKSQPRMDVLIYRPKNVKGRVPVFLGLNFDGNQTVHSDPGIPLSSSWVSGDPNTKSSNGRATEASRGIAASRWQVEKIIARGYALVTIHYGDIDPDFHDGFQNGVHPLFYKEGQTKPAADEWGTIGAWAWGLSRAMDYLETTDWADTQRVIVIGHSRLGKTALWAVAQDQRFAMAISNNSGEGGAAIARRRFGETISKINRRFPHWFNENFKKYNEREDDLPVDAHMLISLIAPRPVYIASATEDRWADPKGEFLSGVHAEPVYQLFGKTGLGTSEMPAPDHPVGKTVGYHLRTGNHDVKAYDWDQYLDFADRNLGKPK